MRNIKDADFTFVIPHWSQDSKMSNQLLDETLQGIFAQTDTKWKIVIVDDNSPDIDAKKYLEKLEKQNSDKIKVILKDKNDGPGTSRNIGIEWAYNNNSPVILYNDADDISNKRRVEVVRNTFLNDEEVSVVYSGFKVIDENSSIVNREKLTPSILEILVALDENPPQGYDTWIDIGTQVGYVNLTSATAVKTEVAYKYPFPKVLVSEDQYAWFMYSADGGKYAFTEDIPSLYRIPMNTGSATRSRLLNYYELKAKVDTEGFMQAINVALLNGIKNEYDVNSLLNRFYIKLANTLYKENEMELARNQIVKASKLSCDQTEVLCLKFGMQDLWKNIKSNKK